MSEIGQAIGRSRGSIAKLIYTFRDQFEGRKKEVNSQLIKELSSKGHSCKEIADMTGHNDDTIRLLVGDEVRNRRTTATLNFVEKPTPENTVIQYEFQEHDMPTDALNIPFWQTLPGQCIWMAGSFWDEPKHDTLCCGKKVMNMKSTGQQRSYCEYHYKISIEEIKE